MLLYVKKIISFLFFKILVIIVVVLLLFVYIIILPNNSNVACIYVLDMTYKHQNPLDGVPKFLPNEGNFCFLVSRWLGALEWC
jgi:hypothetical protein